MGCFSPHLESRHKPGCGGLRGIVAGQQPVKPYSDSHTVTFSDADADSDPHANSNRNTYTNSGADAYSEAITHADT